MAQTGFTPIQLYSTSTAAAVPVAGNLTNSTLGSELAINITDGKLFYKDNANAIQVIGWKVVPTSAGGTGLTSYTAGDLLYYASGTTLTKLGIGAANTVLTSSGSAPQWSTNLNIGSLTATSISDSGNLTFTGTGNRITGDFSNATLANRVYFQNNSVQQTALGVIPGAGFAIAALNIFSQSDPANAALFQARIENGADVRLSSTITGTGTFLPITFYTGGSERMRVDTSGNLGIGTTSPIVPLDIYNATVASLRVQSDAVVNMQLARFSTDTTSAASIIRKGRGTVASPSAVASGDTMGQFIFSAFGGTNNRNLAAITGVVETYTSDTNISSNLQFSTTPTGGVSAAKRLQIDAAGYSQFVSNNVMPYQGAPTSKAAAATLTGAELVTGILNTTGTTYTITLPTGTDIEGALTWVANNVSLDWWVVNTASGIITIAANGNTTLGSLTVAIGASAHFRIRRTASSTFTVYRLS
jgi:hypothetical protein